MQERKSETRLPDLIYRIALESDHNFHAGSRREARTENLLNVGDNAFNLVTG